jgi:hypothetical protein
MVNLSFLLLLSSPPHRSRSPDVVLPAARGLWRRFHLHALDVGDFAS